MRHRRLWLSPAAAALAVALVAGGLGAFFGLRASRVGTGGSAQQPPARLYAAMAFDATSGDVVLFGGIGVNGPLNDTWTWDGVQWTRHDTTTRPAAEETYHMASDPVSGRVILVGAPYQSVATIGTGTSAPPPPARSPAASQTWRWDGYDWRPANGPEPAATATSALATDYAAGNVVLLAESQARPQPLHPCPRELQPPGPAADCGAVGASVDTWLWNGNTWHKTATGGQPAAVATQFVSPGSFLVTDPRDGHVDLLSLSGVLPEPCPELVPRPSPLLVPPPSPVLVPPPSPVSASGLPVPPPAETDVPVPTVSSPPGPSAPCIIAGNGIPATPRATYTLSHWDGKAWNSAVTSGALPADAQGATAAVTDATLRSIVVLQLNAGRVWTFDGRWKMRVAQQHPSVEAGTTGVTYDAQRREILLFGGANLADVSAQQLSNETWTWDGTSWQKHGGSLTAVSGR